MAQITEALIAEFESRLDSNLHINSTVGEERQLIEAWKAWNRRAETQVPEWQPIETAPKDGTRVILGNKYGVWMGEFCDTYQAGHEPQSPWQSVLLNHDRISKQRSYFPTHWMPLPAAPEVKQ